MNSPSDPGFEVPISGTVRELLIRLHDMAAANGRKEEFLDALRGISARLRRDPITFGEEVFDLKELQLTVKVAVVLPVAVEFAVYPVRRFVFIRAFRYIPPIDS
ncbi:MAG TPA: hypothetical protein VG122_01680 [Gemmata sp.]|jgi:hypothetical protein|nr:hypothetical protein [Gemmata sp.]